ncbi:MAG: iron-sulfur cluster assembly scaffold protein [Desulfobacterales bacterium]|nr:iron-sulfur cluster assembly scaffold protein [Desulfobacterales bacterium]
MGEVSEKFLEFGLKTSEKKILKDFDGYGKAKGECGDTIEYYIKIEDEVLVSVKYNIDGCINSNACANALIHLSNGKSIKQTLAITPSDIEIFLESLPKNEFHCAEMAVEAMKGAMKYYFKNSKNPWKKNYSKIN